MEDPLIKPWQNEHRIEVLLNHPAVRFRIEQAAQSSSRPMSAERIMKMEFGVISAIPGLNLIGLAGYLGSLAGRPIAEARGWRVERTASTSYSQPIGQVTVALLCALARNGYPIQRTAQREDGCFLEAMLPSNWQSWKGTIACTVTRKPGGTDIQVGTMIPGKDTILTKGWADRGTKVISSILDEVRRDSASF
jgi:hypothetical protein